MVDLITEEEASRLERAVQQAESRTSAEIVLMVRRSATDYAAVETMAAAIASLALPAALLPFTSIPALVIWIAQLLLFAALAILLPMVSAGRWFVGRGRVVRDVEATARAEFFAHGLRRTSRRGAVLVFVAMREHVVDVIADDGASAAVDDGTWADVAAMLAARIRDGDVVGGLEATAGRIADLLAEKLPPDDGSGDELPNLIVR